MPPNSSVCFLRGGQPPSANKNVGPQGKAIQQELQSLFRKAGGKKLAGHLYGIVYYFVSGYSPSRHADADNISKRIWDALEGVAYDDGQMVRLRIAGVVEVGSSIAGAPSYAELDLTDMSADAADHLLDLVGARVQHFVYVEIGPVSADMFRFNLLSGKEFE